MAQQISRSVSIPHYALDACNCHLDLDVFQLVKENSSQNNSEVPVRINVGVVLYDTIITLYVYNLCLFRLFTVQCIVFWIIKVPISWKLLFSYLILYNNLKNFYERKIWFG